MREGWQTKTLGDVCHVYQPETISQKQMAGGEYAVYGANGPIGWHNQFNHEAAQLILGCRGSCGSVHITEPRSWINGNAMVVQPKTDLIAPAYLAYALRGGVDLKDSITGTAQPQITRASLMPVAISYPEALPEQQRIVALLDEAFAGLATAKANAEQNLQNARAIFESHLQSVFSQRGEGWVEHTLGDLIHIQNGYAFKSTDYTETGFFVIRISNVQDGEITLANPRFIKLADKKHERFILNGGDILISLTGNIGRVGIIQEDQLPAVLNQRVARITIKDNNADCNFLFRFLLSRTFRESLQEAGHGAAQQNVSTKEIESVQISLPDKKEQRCIVEEFDSFAVETQRLTRLYERKLAALEELKKSLLHQAFNGEL
jgi:type I restriction enzyme S subunit